MLLVKRHRPGQEGLQVDDRLGAVTAAALKHDSESQHRRLDCLGQSGAGILAFQEFAAQVLENHIRSNPLGQQLV